MRTARTVEIPAIAHGCRRGSPCDSIAAVFPCVLSMHAGTPAIGSLEFSPLVAAHTQVARRYGLATPGILGPYLAFCNKTPVLDDGMCGMVRRSPHGIAVTPVAPPGVVTIVIRPASARRSGH